jgi:hypothetical protein
MFKFLTILISTAVLLNSPALVAAEIKIDSCLTAQVDMDSLNVLNQFALEIFPFVTQPTDLDGVQVVDGPELENLYRSLKKEGAFQGAYQSLLDNLQAFLLSGGIMISSIDLRLRGANFSYSACGDYNFKPTGTIEESVLRNIPNLSPLLVNAINEKMKDSALRYQEEVISDRADSAYFLFFGFRSWQEKNRKEQADFANVISCTLDRVVDSNSYNISPELKQKACAEVKKTDRYVAYRTFLMAAIFNSMLVSHYVRSRTVGVPFGIEGHLFSKSVDSLKKLFSRPYLGGAALQLAQSSGQQLFYYFAKNNDVKNLDSIEKISPAVRALKFGESPIR